MDEKVWGWVCVGVGVGGGVCVGMCVCGVCVWGVCVLNLVENYFCDDYFVACPRQEYTSGSLGHLRAILVHQKYSGIYHDWDVPVSET